MTGLDLVIWVIAFLLQGSLLGIVMYMLICLSDLENDFLNPYDCANNLNRWVLPEIYLQAALAALVLLGGKWFCVLLTLPVAAWNIRKLMRSEHRADVTEILRDVQREKGQRLVKLGFYFVGFIVMVFKMIETAVWTLLTPAGREAARELLHEAIAHMHV